MGTVSDDRGNAREETIDLRSDAVTQPTEAMWEAMRRAPLGWALVGEDPSVNELETLAAQLSGKQAALLVPTATMANLIALMSHTQRGDQVILEASSHILWCEEWGLGHICGLVPRVVRGEAGHMVPGEIQTAITESIFGHRPRTGLICLENTHNVAGGTIITPEETSAVACLAREYGIRIHLDGARIFNAAVALGVDLQTLVRGSDTVTINLTKGLSAPQGAVLCGSEDLIQEGRSKLRILGGNSIHQAGIFAAAGVVALRTMIPQLAEDNRRAQDLARGLAELNTKGIKPQPVQTNIVMVRVERSFMTAACILSQLAASGIRASQCSEDIIRFVTHRHINDEHIKRVVSAIYNITVMF